MSIQNNLSAIINDALIPTAELGAFARAAREHEVGLIAAPTSISSLAHEGGHDHESAEPLDLVSWAGYPTGKQHLLIKAAEARLAIQSGAAAVAVVVDPVGLLADTDTALLGELIGLRSSVPAPAGLYAVIDLDVIPYDKLLQVLKWLDRAPIDAIVLTNLGWHQRAHPHLAIAALTSAWQQLVQATSHPFIAVCDTKTAPAPIAAGAAVWITDLNLESQG
ncbi:MAG: hypothetical protein Q3976_02620 [Corynebacterium sp.]|nr:hypothetical protein [Corynebacterium sp.]